MPGVITTQNMRNYGIYVFQRGFSFARLLPSAYEPHAMYICTCIKGLVQGVVQSPGIFILFNFTEEIQWSGQCSMHHLQQSHLLSHWLSMVMMVSTCVFIFSISLLVAITKWAIALYHHGHNYYLNVFLILFCSCLRRFLPSGGHAADPATSNDVITYDGATATNLTVHSNTTSLLPVNPPIEYPFAIVGGITALVGLVQLIICCFRYYLLSHMSV